MQSRFLKLGFPSVHFTARVQWSIMEVENNGSTKCVFYWVYQMILLYKSCKFCSCHVIVKRFLSFVFCIIALVFSSRCYCFLHAVMSAVLCCLYTPCNRGLGFRVNFVVFRGRSVGMRLVIIAQRYRKLCELSVCVCVCDASVHYFYDFQKVKAPSL